ncbi:TetR family transcriptional regulator [Micromonospora sp. NBC_00362]|uniref:TetR/AcrR family transcriptional regulator n=1 Tax=Micromonospora sp. NBC_00362 TaxID=2975975 RepID=UPI00225432DC|nr:TetR/AcrR family transcriptional regulator [Micromonospora sp. NBC_00362]MCX5121768.1 TetR family transcriptional regulator [Micromonospora sp. NBC_00362]
MTRSVPHTSVTVCRTCGRMPPPNDRRRAQITDAAITLLTEAGVHGVTHRAADSKAGLPTGTASNYFRSREALLVAVTRRVAELHQADMADAAATTDVGGNAIEHLVELIAGSLLHSATAERDRYLAIFELRLESLRRPALAAALDTLTEAMAAYTAAYHSQLRLEIPPDAVRPLMALYGGALFTLITAPPETVTPATTQELATAIVRGAIG